MFPYRWHKTRRIIHEALNSRSVQAYRELEQKQAASLVLQLLRDPDGWYGHVEQ